MSVILPPTPPPVVKAPYVKMIPSTLLIKPLPSEKLQVMSEEEKRLYNIQKGKYDTYMRILVKKEQQNEHPKDMRFTLAECPMLMVGAHHEEEEEEEHVETNEVPMNYLGREDTFKQ